MKSWHIAGYTFNAKNICCNCARDWARDILRSRGYSEAQIEEIESGETRCYDGGVYAETSEKILVVAAEKVGVDIENYYSFDSAVFPKVVFADQIQTDETCGKCFGQLIS